MGLLYLSLTCQTLLISMSNFDLYTDQVWGSIYNFRQQREEYHLSTKDGNIQSGCSSTE